MTNPGLGNVRVISKSQSHQPFYTERFQSWARTIDSTSFCAKGPLSGTCISVTSPVIHQLALFFLCGNRIALLSDRMLPGFIGLFVIGRSGKTKHVVLTTVTERGALDL